MKRFAVLVGDGKVSVQGVPGEFRASDDGLEKKLVRAVAEFYHCNARPVMFCGTMDYVETDLPDDYEPCGDCGYDHVYDSPIPDGPRVHVTDPRKGPRLTYPDLASVPERN